jgi:hypothetical protein
VEGADVLRDAPAGALLLHLPALAPGGPAGGQVRRAGASHAARGALGGGAGGRAGAGCQPGGRRAHLGRVGGVGAGEDAWGGGAGREPARVGRSPLEGPGRSRGRCSQWRWGLSARGGSVSGDILPGGRGGVRAGCHRRAAGQLEPRGRGGPHARSHPNAD